MNECDNDNNDDGVRNLVEAAAKGIVMMAEQSGIEAVDDGEVDELLHWTNALNFDRFVILDPPTLVHILSSFR